MAKKAVEKERVGIMAFSFALRKQGRGEPSPCNRGLGSETMRAVRYLKYRRKESVLVSQWEVALALPKSQAVAHVIQEHRTKGQYLDSEEVVAQGVEAFRAEGVTKVIVIANSFLHLTKCKRLVRQAGLEIYRFKVRWMGFDKLSDQWQTRSRIKALIYALGQLPKVFGGSSHGPAH